MTKVQTAIAEQYAQVVAKAWEDEAFKQRLMANPGAVLQELGLRLPAGKVVRVVENTAETTHLVLPSKPSGELSAKRLDPVAWERQETAKQLEQVMVKAWEDEAFKQRLMANPRAVLQERGLPPPTGQTVRVIENTAETSYLVLPAKPPVGELADDQLELVAGGFVSEVYQVVDGLSKFAMLYAIAGAGYTWRGASGDPWE